MLTVSQEYEVKVVNILPKGIVVEYVNGEEPGTGFVHLSKISPDFVANIADFVKVGETYTAKAVDSPVKGVELSLVHLNLKSDKEDSDRRKKESFTSRKRKVSTSPYRGRSFDDMIEAAEKSFQDKTRRNPNKGRRR